MTTDNKERRVKKQSSAAKGKANSTALQSYIQPIKEIGNTPIVSSKPFAVCCFFSLIGKVEFFAENMLKISEKAKHITFL